MEKLKVLELFGGIGACTAALKRLGIDYEVVDYVEIDKYAVKSYNAINGTNFVPQDITEWDKAIEADLIMHGSPCQDFSAAGVNKGGDEGSGTRSSLMYETLRIVEKVKPKYVIWENVKNLLSEKHRHNFDQYVSYMAALGYTSYYKVLNAKDFGIPQNRERIFTISIKNTIGTAFAFPYKKDNAVLLQDLLEKTGETRHEDIYIDSSVKKSVADNIEREKAEIKASSKAIYTCNCTSGWCDNRVALKLAPTLRANNNSAYCLTEDNVVRKFTAKECWRLMGFTDEEYEKAARVNSAAQLYKQAGNSIVVNVLEAILKELLNASEAAEHKEERRGIRKIIDFFKGVKE